MGEVVTLPTAASRKVRNRNNRGTRAIARTLPQFPDKFVPPSVRNKAENARAISELERTPALAIAVSIFQALDDNAKEAALKTLIKSGTGSASNAHALLATHRFTFGELSDTMRAMTLLKEGKL